MCRWNTVTAWIFRYHFKKVRMFISSLLSSASLITFWYWIQVYKLKFKSSWTYHQLLISWTKTISDAWTVCFNEHVISGYSTVHVCICKPMTINTPHIHLAVFYEYGRKAFHGSLSLENCLYVLKQWRMSQTKWIIQCRNVWKSF